MLFHFWFLFILCLFSCYCNQKCNDNVIKYSISQCNENLSQNVIVSNPNECDVSNYTFPKSLIGIKCTECKKGTHLAYNYHNKQMECHICPYNTYSTGSLFRINGKYNEWNSHSLDSFLNNCYVVGNNNEENQFCEGYTISNDHSTLITSNPNIKEYLGKLYVAQLSLSISIIKECTFVVLVVNLLERMQEKTLLLLFNSMYKKHFQITIKDIKECKQFYQK